MMILGYFIVFKTSIFSPEGLFCRKPKKGCFCFSPILYSCPEPSDIVKLAAAHPAAELWGITIK
jgi:hypothetical protein